VDWIHLERDMVQYSAAVKVEMKLLIQLKTDISLGYLRDCSFPKQYSPPPCVSNI
jgi:hypothetical protein